MDGSAPSKCGRRWIGFARRPRLRVTRRYERKTARAEIGAARRAEHIRQHGAQHLHPLTEIARWRWRPVTGIMIAARLVLRAAREITQPLRVAREIVDHHNGFALFTEMENFETGRSGFLFRRVVHCASLLAITPVSITVSTPSGIQKGPQTA